MSSKRCYTCKKIRSGYDFYKSTRNEDGLADICKECSKKKSKQYYLDNKEKLNIYGKKYRENKHKQNQQVS